MSEQPAAASTIPVSPLARVSLRDEGIMIGPIIPEDTAEIFLWLNDVESAGLDLSWRPVDWMAYNNWLASFHKNSTQVIFAIRAIGNSRIIGFVALSKIDTVHRSAELAVRIGAESDRGHGYGKHAIRLALAYAWNHLNLNRVCLNVFESNRRAIGAYRGCGFEYEGKLRQAAFINGDWIDVVLMGILRSAQS